MDRQHAACCSIACGPIDETYKSIVRENIRAVARGVSFDWRSAHARLDMPARLASAALAQSSVSSLALTDRALDRCTTSL